MKVFGESKLRDEPKSSSTLFRGLGHPLSSVHLGFGLVVVMAKRLADAMGVVPLQHKASVQSTS